jgi:AcrR family transcriptional regulator
MPARPGLDREKIVHAAAELLDEARGGDITLGQVARRLGVRTPSLYNHIAGQDALRRGLALAGIRELGERIGRAAIGKAGSDAILAIGHAYRAFAHERPGLYQATLRAPAPDDIDLLAAVDDVLSILRIVLEPYGLSDEDEIHVIRALRSLAHGFVSLELAGGFGIPVDLNESYQRLLDQFLVGLRGQITGSKVL